LSEQVTAELPVRIVEPVKDRRGRALRTRTWLHVPAVAAAMVLAQPSVATLAWGLPLVVLGLLVRTWALGHICKDEKLCVDGPYSLVRHPLYLGNLIVLAGLLVVAWSPVMAVAATVAAALNYRAVLGEEERGLEARFGDEWREYVARTPGMVPRLRRPTGGFSLKHAVFNKAELSWLAVAAVTVLLMLKPWVCEAMAGVVQ
jgi:protein-S-isoprenylcysteine O-methyltransferase Ste14